MSEAVSQAPNFDVDTAQTLVAQHFDRRGHATPLPSERDQNFRIDADDGCRYVFKIANALESRASLELQHAMFEHLAAASLPIATPRVYTANSGETLISVTHGGRQHLVRLLDYLPGRCLAHSKPHDRELLEHLGEGLGAMDAALARFDHPAAHREFAWDLRRALACREHIDAIDGDTNQQIVRAIFDHFESHVVPRLDTLPRSVIHNDWNDYNVLVTEPGSGPRRIAGVIDFGDTVFSNTVGDLAIACAYAMLDKPDPVGTASCIVAGYHRHRALSPAELEVLFSLIQVRLAQSVCTSARQKRLAPENRYLTISEAPAWALLHQLASIAPSLSHYRFRAACHLEPCPVSPAVGEWLRATRADRHPLMGVPFDQANTIVFDCSVGSPQIAAEMHAGPADHPLFDRVHQAGARFGIGRYNEARSLYIAPGFAAPGIERPLQRSIHLGIDVFAPAGTPVYAPLPGTIHSVRDNDKPLDYGPTIIVAHDCPAGRFYTLYGHLARTSMIRWQVGQSVAAGDELGTLGVASENGGWHPHVHVQIVIDLLHDVGDFLGAASPDERETWLSLSPDPNLLLGIPDACFPPPRRGAEALARSRQRHLGGALSLSYRSPLHIVRGYMQHLFDADGRSYLDAVNNVPHVGHCHPRVVAATRDQTAVLNTNTRYLHESIVELAERLTATLPDPLRVCYFVCSGSEANELALRLARAHTGSRELLVLDHAYHGNTGNLVEMSPYKFKRRGGFAPPDHVHVLPVPDAYRGEFRGSPEQVLDPYTQAVDTTVSGLVTKGKRPGALFCESLPGCAGQIELVPGYLARAFALVRAAGGVCVADEVQVGFGRVGTHFWGFQTQGVVPDIVTMGKPMGNGHPIAAVVTTPEIAESFANGMEYFNTFGGNPVSCATALAVLDVLHDERLQERAHRTGERLLAGFRELAQEHPVIGDVRGRGLYLGVELVSDREQRHPATHVASYVADRMKDRGVLISTDGPDANVLKIKPPLAFDEGNAEELLQVLADVLEEDIPRAAGRSSLH